MLWDYQKGILSRDQIRIVEHHLADCEMCSDYIEGISILSNEKELENETEKVVSKIFNKITKKNKIWLYATAASLLIAVALSSLIFLLPSKNNYVADETINNISKEVPPETGVKQPDNLGWIKNETEASGNKTLLKQQVDKKSINNTRFVAPVVVDDEISGNGVQEEQQEVLESDNLKTITTVNADIVEKTTVTVFKEKEKSPGKSDLAGDELSEESKLGLVDNLKSKDAESYKKNNADKSISKSEDSRGYTLGGASTGQAAVPSIAAEETVTTSASFSTVEQNNESIISDLDKATDFFNKELLDSSIVYALKGANSSNDNNKWKSKLCLAKAYIAKGEKEKAIPILKEIKAKASYKISKEADAELEKLGN
jgi:FimV-like protein